MTEHHDLNRAPFRPSRVLQAWQAERRQTVQRQRDAMATSARAYDGAARNRLTSDWMASGTSADSELLASLRELRNRSRDLVRNNPYAKQVVRVFGINVIGEGVGMQAQVKSAGGKLQKNINDGIEAAWAKWADPDSCHVAGKLGFADIERLCFHQLVTTGECIVRKVRGTFGRRNKVPLSLEVIEADRLLDNWQTAHAPNGNIIRMGVETDQWGRPTAYWFHPVHPGDYQFTTFQPNRFVRIPAQDILHLYIIDRWPQTRGEPWLHAAIRGLHDEHGTTESEIVKARAAANIVGFIKGPDALNAGAEAKHREVVETEPGLWQRLLPGEDVAGMSSYGPNPTLDPFLRYLVRKQCVGVGLSYESVSRDYSQSNYSSNRMGALPDRDLFRVLQGWWCRCFRADIHREWLDAAVLVGEVTTGSDYYSNPDKYQAVRFRPRGWSWIDPTKEEAAYAAAVRDGFMTQEDVIAQTSPHSDLEAVLDGRQAELAEIDSRDLMFDTDSRKPRAGAAAPQAPAKPESAAAGAASDDDESQAAQAETDEQKEPA